MSAEGYPLTLVNLFMNGFPENWRNVLDEYFHVLLLTELRVYRPYCRKSSMRNVTKERNPVSLSEFKKRKTGFETLSGAMGISSYRVSFQNTTAMDSGNHLMDKCAAECRPSSPERTRQSSAEPIIQSPVSISSQSNRRDCENELIEVESYSDRGSSRPGCTRGESVSLSNSRAVVLAGLPFNINSSARQTNFKGQSDDAVELTGWSIRFTPAGSGGPPLGFPKFVLLGTRKNHPVQWQSSVVVRVESASIIHTSSTKYRLVGEMNIVDSAYAGFPKLFVSMFLQGFPPDWRTRIAELYNDFFGHLNMPSGNEVGAIDSSRRHRLSQENEVTESRTFREVDEEPCIDDSLHRPERHAQDNALVPLHGQQSSADVRRSRSGRCLRPPLANWAGQRVRYDGAGNVIGIEDVNTSTILSRRITDTSALSKYYGISPPTTSRQCEKYLDVPELAADRGAKKLKKKKVTYSDSSDSENERRKKRVVASSSEDDDDSRGYHHKRKQADWEIDDLASDMRKERQLILKQARELQKQQEYLQKKQKELMAIERRIAEKEAIWRKKTKKIERNKSVRKQSVYNGDDGEDMANYRHTKSKTGARNGCNRLPRFVDDDERRYVDEREQQRRRIEVEWARQNEQYSSASDQIDDDSYQEPGLP
ncbi:unnamed protein product [Heligmosomoides polygyrus]|uniref:SANTA domain-containing protein n=1 Tax=Heligmosomoides polygyrus TaxID=6339 RepID=A0A3P8BDM8_HELPZ|nr:unnamed protein product [Heligmosomoides polygyrus]